MRHVVVTLGFCGLHIAIFAPDMLAGRLLAPGDALLQSIPAFYSEFALWTPYLFTGFPVLGDPQTMTWYWPAWVLASFGSWNAFVVLGYVLASCFTYLYVWRLTRVTSAAILSGTIFGMSGFLVSNLPAPHIIHAAAWLPLMLWSVEELARRREAQWIALLALAVSSSVLAGHPQTSVYAGGLLVAYTTWRVFGVNRGSRIGFAMSCTLGVAIGLLLSAILILPMIELASESVRSEISFPYFATGALSFSEALATPFPAWMGASSMSAAHGYVGAFAILLALIAVVVSRGRREVAFWATVSIVGFLLAFGAWTPLARLMYALPGYQSFRAPIRHLFEFSFAIAVLAGIGMAGLRSCGMQRGSVLLARGALLSAFGLIGLFILQQQMPFEEASPAENSTVALLTAVVVLAACSTAMAYWQRSPSTIRAVLVAATLVLDLGYVSRNAAVMTRLPTADDLELSADLRAYRDVLDAGAHRILPFNGTATPTAAARPNVSRLWEVPSAGGYNPLILRRYSEFLRMAPNGRIGLAALDSRDTALDLLGVRYITVPHRGTALDFVESHGMIWPTEDLDLTLGDGCGEAHPQSLELPLDDVVLERIGFVSAMACSESVLQESEVLRVTLSSTSSPPQRISLLAGVDTSEWAWERRDVQEVVAHERAEIFRTFSSADDDGRGFDGLHYVTVRPMRTTGPVNRMRLDWVAPTGEIALIRFGIEDVEGNAYQISPADHYLVNDPRWVQRESLDSSSVFENLRAMPRVWLTSVTETLSSEELLLAVHESVLPDGREYEPGATALVEEPIEIAAGLLDAGSSARIVASAPERVEIDVNASKEAFLVLADTFYPGWMGYIDDTRVRIMQTNYVMRGVPVPAGAHRVTFVFRPFTFYLGLVLSGVGLVSLLVILGIKLRR